MQPSASVPRRLAIVALAGLAAFLVPVLPASAHVEATVSDGTQAGGEPVALTLWAEAERGAAGISGIKTQLLEGIRPEWVSRTSGPPGWALTTTADGYQ